MEKSCFIQIIISSVTPSLPQRGRQRKGGILLATLKFHLYEKPAVLWFSLTF
jgi:hypothetical protein